jgi:hypothetical protein
MNWGNCEATDATARKLDGSAPIAVG